MPQREAHRCRVARDGGRCESERRVDERRRESDDQSHATEHQRSQPEGWRCLMGVLQHCRASDKWRHARHQSSSPEERTRGDGGHDENHTRPHAKLSEVTNAVVELLFRDEPEKQRHTRHRSSGEHGRNSGDRHAVAKSAELGHVARARLVLHSADDEKERTLVARVRQEVGQAGDHSLARSDAEQQHEHAERADRGVREHPLEIRFQHRSVRATHHCHGAHEGDDSCPEK